MGAKVPGMWGGVWAQQRNRTWGWAAWLWLGSSLTLWVAGAVPSSHSAPAGPFANQQSTGEADKNCFSHGTSVLVGEMENEDEYMERQWEVLRRKRKQGWERRIGQAALGAVKILSTHIYKHLLCARHCSGTWDTAKNRPRQTWSPSWRTSCFNRGTSQGENGWDELRW